MVGMREFFGRVLAVFKLPNDLPDRMFVFYKSHHAATPFEQKNSPARKFAHGRSSLETLD
jgi:hypothetical protein